MTADFISIQDPRWSRALERSRYDVYHLPEYVKCAAEEENLVPTAFYAEKSDEFVLIPLMIRPLPAWLDAPSDWRDAASPYGFPGPIMSNACSDGLLESFMDAFVRLAGVFRLVSVFIRLHPLIPFPLGACRTAGTVVNHGQTVVVELHSSGSELQRGLRHGHRQPISKLMRSGFKVRFDDWTLLNDVEHVYMQTMRRVGAGDFFHFSSSYFSSLRSALGERLHLCTVHSPKGDVAAAGLFTEVNGVVQFHLSGSASRYRRLSPSKLLVHEMILWSKDRGNRILHLGGGVAGHEDSLFSFKAGFSESRADFHTLRIVTDPLRYSLFIGMLEHRRGTQQELSDGDGTAYFPGYRRDHYQSRSELCSSTHLR